MFTTSNGANRSNATAADCARLWATLTTEYIPGLQMVITPVVSPAGDPAIRIEVLDKSAYTVNGEEWVNVWAAREFQNGLNLISVGSLFDLLITAYRKVDEFFEKGERSAPARRQV